MPRQIWGGIRDWIEPYILAMTTLLIVFAALPFARITAYPFL
ncbi:hypothetical protein [Caballeronia sordidicola]|jgi:ABC-type spermidine/putrescine transport system permease subunit II|nr:hypothetical protein [Caballeronia sordidicola]